MISVTPVLERIRAILAEAAKASGPLRPPVDPCELAELFGVMSIERRPMIPEGVLVPQRGGFRMYLQSNFSLDGQTDARARFTVAHELGHALLYDLNAEVPVPLKGSPKGERLERLCNVAASEILVPESLIKNELQSARVASADEIFVLASRFRVSVEMMMRRLHELELTADDQFAAVLVDAARSGNASIRAACYGPLLLCNVSRPKIGSEFASWVLPLLSPTGTPNDCEWVHDAPSAKIAAKKVFRSPRSFILDIRFSPPMHGALE